jgi:SAM-dependent methyltransferase
VLELGCGTGRVTAPLLRHGVPLVGVDRSPAMLARARRRLKRIPVDPGRHLVLADITALPFADGSFATVIAPYGILQSLLSDRALGNALEAVARVLPPGGRFGTELVPDVPRWKEGDRKLTLIGLEGPNGLPVRMVETVRQDRARRLTVFEQQFVEGTGRSRRVLSLTVRFRTLPVPTMCGRLERAGFLVERVSGGYRHEPWSEDAPTWIVTAVRR